MFKIGLPTKGVENLNNKFSKVKENQDKVIAEKAQRARDYARQMAPRKTGNLARSIYARKVSHAVWEVGTAVKYAWAVEYGSGVFAEGPTATGEPITPKKGDYLAFQIGGKWIRVRYVLGQHPQPFIRPACERVEGTDTKLMGD